MILIHACMMQCMYLWPSILDPDTCMCDAYIYYPWSWHMCVWCMYSWCGIFIKHGQTLTLMHINMMHICTMHIHMLLDHYAYVHDALMYDACMHDAISKMHICNHLSLTLIYVCMHDPQSWCMMHDAYCVECTMRQSPLKSCVKEFWFNASLSPHFPSV